MSKAVKEKNIEFIELWKDFWKADEQEKSEEEVILSNETLSEEVKRELLKTLKDTDKMANKMFRNSYKVTKLKADKAIEQSKEIDSEKKKSEEEKQL